MTVSLPDALKRQIKSVADSEKRKMSNWIVKLLEEHFREEDKGKRPPRT